jgi:predicted transcriptional regulator
VRESSDVALKVKERHEFDVVANILRLAAIGSKKEEIMIGCNLNRQAVEKYTRARRGKERKTLPYNWTRIGTAAFLSRT